MNATQQWYEMIAAEFHRIEELKADAMERGEIICNLTAAMISGEISQSDYDDLLACVCSESEAK